MKGNYRADIDGLRAIAVLSVLFFHFDHQYLPGGYLGVDIFFVISGYLITNIVYSELKKGNFSYSNFYTRRVKRILPAFFFMLFLTLIIGYFVFLPYEYYKLSISALSTLFFSSNIQYAFRTNDYFAADSSEWPLLHTWSLAVEEQYYFILPVLLIFLLKFFPKRVLICFTLIAFFSFFLGTFWAYSNELNKLAYYSLPTRAGELLSGSILAVYLYEHKNKYLSSNFLASLSLLIILLFLIFLDSSTRFPGLVVLPVCIAVCVLIASKNTSINNFLGSNFLVKVGLISYSLYLMHWPVLAFFRYILSTEGYALPLMVQFLAIGIILVLSLISYYYVEKPFRIIKTGFLKSLLCFLIVPSLLIMILGYFIISTHGYPERLSSHNFNANKAFTHLDKSVCPSLISLGCEAVSPLSIKGEVLLFGNSHAEHYFTFISSLASDNGLATKLIASGGCEPDTDSVKCNPIKQYLLDKYDSADYIFIAYRWDALISKVSAFEALSKIVADIDTAKNKIIFLAQPPRWSIKLNRLVNCYRLHFNCPAVVEVQKDYPEYNEFIKAFAKERNMSYFDPFLRVNDYLKTQSENGNPYYFDDNHLSIYGNEMLFEANKNIKLEDL